MLEDDEDEEAVEEVGTMEAIRFLFRDGEGGWNPR